MAKEEIETFYPTNPQDWRTWLEVNHDKQQAVWLIFYKKKSKKKTISWSEAVDEALCYGWIDSKRQTIDEEKFRQFFSRRKLKSTWSTINKDKVIELTEKGLMTKAGFACIDIAKQNGSWSILDSVDALEVPADLQKALESYPTAVDFFSGLSKSNKKILLYWVISAKRAETRQKRINEIAKQAGEGKKPKQFR